LYPAQGGFLNKIIGRKKEQETLQKILDSTEPVFLAVYGRRRIGKTYLIRHFFKNKGLFFHITGSQNASVNAQLQLFADEFSDVFLKGQKSERPENWLTAFRKLKKEIEKISDNTKIILFFDELPWLASPRSNFLQALEHLWNRYLSDIPNVILIVCGSAASWMIDNVLHDEGGLHGRVTKEMRLLPFTLGETEEFLEKKNIFLDRKKILELYMCLGGVAKYLSYLERGKSVPQLIGDLFFSYSAPLISEFHQLYRSLFQHYEEHVQIVKVLATSRSGFSYKELVKKLKLPSGGTFSKRLEELKQSGFIAEIPLFGKKDYHYLLVDEYSLFYLTWSADVPALDLQSRGSDYWMKQQSGHSWKGWTGHAYECLCFKHVEGIKAALGLAAVQTRLSKWEYKAPKKSKEAGAQIDLVIDRADNCINLCEIKFYQGEFIISKEEAQKLQRKKECFERVTKVRKPTFTTLITTHGAKHNDSYLSAIDQEVNMDALFFR
jgi:predicted AAA+ superfamily ATPase